MQATIAKVQDGGCVSEVMVSSADATQSGGNGQKSSLPKPQNYGSWTVVRRCPLDKKSSFCCGGSTPRYRESVIKCLADYKLLPETTAKSGTGVNV
ncbi:hypothetical protein [Endozoicomonas sp. SCSIO W0465]|uniref:hypothetical protein n=1 Tax=Endozoicomonas sp. SCSIO W0465 TaxID=2918516 RepID=UPI0020754CC3|nr:hypothetical protein [Endozoicomonas sp. SCSIO W0465]USE38784.1 hypothetical protein MJO57_11790 [Endozoicomonas sp. SCSIO W0465]